MNARRLRGDNGQILLLVLGYTVIAALLVTVVVDVSAAFLGRRALSGAADAAALAAANQPDLDRLYGGEDTDVLPLSVSGTDAAVRRYVVDARLADRFDGFGIGEVITDGTQVTVTLRAVVHLPLAGLISDDWRDGVPVDATATAQTPFTTP